MATKEQIEMIFEYLDELPPADFLKRMSETSAGIGAVLRLLYESEDTITAGKISSFMNVSTARVAVLLKKMVAKGLILKESDATDARITIVRLSPLGRETIEKMRDDLFKEVGTVIDEVGIERMMEFIAISKEIHAILKGPTFHFD